MLRLPRGFFVSISEAGAGGGVSSRVCFSITPTSRAASARASCSRRSAFSACCFHWSRSRSAASSRTFKTSFSSVATAVSACRFASFCNGVASVAGSCQATVHPFKLGCINYGVAFPVCLFGKLAFVDVTVNRRPAFPGQFCRVGNAYFSHVSPCRMVTYCNKLVRHLKRRNEKSPPS